MIERQFAGQRFAPLQIVFASSFCFDRDALMSLSSILKMRPSLLALCVLNFFMADVTSGLGPFLGVFLEGQHWTPAEIGLVMTVGGIAGMAVTTPLGALVDRTRAKRAI